MIKVTLITCDSPSCTALIDLREEGGKRIYFNQWSRDFKPDRILCPTCKEAQPGYDLSKVKWDAIEEPAEAEEPEPVRFHPGKPGRPRMTHADPDRIAKMLARWAGQEER